MCVCVCVCALHGATGSCRGAVTHEFVTTLSHCQYMVRMNTRMNAVLETTVVFCIVWYSVDRF